MSWVKSLSIERKYNIVVLMSLSVTLLLASIGIVSVTNRSFETIVANNSKEINKQVILNYENYFDNVRQLGYYIELNSRDDDVDTLNPFYSSVAASNPDIYTITLLAYDGGLMASNRPSAPISAYLRDRDWFNRALDVGEVFFFSAPHTQDVFLDGSQEVITVSKEIEYQEDGLMRDGVLVMELSTDPLSNLAQQTNFGEEGHLIITSDNGELIYSSISECISSSCQSNEIVQDLIIGGDFVEVNDRDMYVNINTISGTRWRIATFVNVDIMDQTRNNIILTLLVVLVGILIVSTIFTSFVTGQITKPLNVLKEHMLTLQQSEQLYQEVEVSGQKEVVILAQAYNDMISEIRNLLDRLVNEQTEKRKTELRALQTQINPHFLYNTLDSIVWLSEKKDNDNVIKMVIALSRFFRISISRGKDIIPIKDEIEHANNYLKIQQIRYANSFTYSFFVEDQINEYQVVKLILQPLIENAIQHGIRSDTEGIISVRGYEKDDMVYFAITNSGFGLNEAQIQEIYHKLTDDTYQSVGLKNVVQRLKLYYGENAGIDISSILDESTTITIHFPVKGIDE